MGDALCWYEHVVGRGNLTADVYELVAGVTSLTSDAAVDNAAVGNLSVGNGDT